MSNKVTNAEVKKSKEDVEDDDACLDYLKELEIIVYSYILESIVAYVDSIVNKDCIKEEDIDNEITKETIVENIIDSKVHVIDITDEEEVDDKKDLMEDLTCRKCDYEDDNPRNVSIHRKDVHNMNTSINDVVYVSQRAIS